MNLKRIIIPTLVLASTTLCSFADRKMVVTLYNSEEKEYSCSSDFFNVEVSEKTFAVKGSAINDSYPIVDVQKITFEDNDALNNIESFQISVYPNPASDVLTIQGLEKTGTEIAVSLYDATGKTNNNYKVQDGNELNISNLTPGAYYIVIDGMPTINFIKK